MDEKCDYYDPGSGISSISVHKHSREGASSEVDLGNTSWRITGRRLLQALTKSCEKVLCENF